MILKNLDRIDTTEQKQMRLAAGEFLRRLA